MKILVIGASGTIGTQLADILKDVQGIEMRLATSRPDAVGELEQSYRPAEAVYADLHSVESLTNAIRGVDRVMLITPDLIDEAEVCANVVEAIQVVGCVERLVKLLTFPPGMRPADVRPEDRDMRIGYNQGLVAREVLQRHDLPVVYVNIVSTFMSNILWSARQISEQGKFVMPCPQVSTWVHPRDVAESCAALLLDKEPIAAGTVYDVSGEERLSFDDIALALSEELGFPVAHSSSDGLLHEMFGQDCDLFVRFFESEERYYAEVGTTYTYRRLTGQDSRTLSQWVAENRHACV